MQKILFLLMFVLWNATGFSQELYTPRNITKAYQNNTRSIDGKPGEKYWQNGGDYKIDFVVDTEKKIIKGEEVITYYNNSPDELKSIVLQFVNNIHKPTAARASVVSPDFLTEGLQIKSLAVNDIVYAINSEDFNVNYDLKLKTPLLAKSKNIVKIKWEFPLSKQSEREGQIDDSTFFCAYAYPRIAVYDDYNGWDKLAHNGRQEFYNDFNNYDVTITAPKNFVVYATGVLQNPEQILQPAILKKFKTSLKSDKIIHVATQVEIAQKRVTQQQNLLKWKFKAENITDFTFAISSSYVWDASSVQLKSKRVSTQAAYKLGTVDFEQYVAWENYGIKYFSENWPGVEYPFPTMTAIQGFADMEYPMMVNDTAIPDNLKDSRQTVDHEIAHTYFPFMMGINETRYAFMDEGWATALEYLIGEAENGKEFNDRMFKDFRVKRYINDPSAEEDQPIITMSSQLSGAGYGNNAYVKPAFAYLALKGLLGAELFRKSLHYYMETWQGKHPIPWDFFYSINSGSGKNLNWFWNNWFFSNHYVDLKLNSAKVEKNELSVSITNAGGFAIPADLQIVYTDGTVTNQHLSPKIWENGNSFESKFKLLKGVQSVRIDGGIFLDYTPDDNFINL